MTKDMLIEEISKKMDCSKSCVKECYDAIFSTIADCLKKGDSISVTGFGTFSIVHRKARKGINPKTLQPLQIPATKMPKFKPSSTLKKACK